MGLFDIFKRNKGFGNKKDDLFSIPCDYDGYDFVFKSNITNPLIYDEITKILTNGKISIKNMEEYKNLTIHSDIDVFYEFYDKWMELLRNNKFVIHLDKDMDMNSFAKSINEVLLNIGCSDNIDEKEIVEKYNNELKKYSLDNKEIVDNINYDILQANVMAVELRKLGYELICFFSGFDNDDKTIIPIDKIDEFKKLERSIGLFDKSDLKKENFILTEDAYEFECQDFKLIISEDIYDDDTIEYAKKIVNKYLTDKDSILNYMLEVGLRDFYKNNFKYSDEYIKKEIGKPQIIINFKKDDKHPQWKFEYSGIIDFCESNLDEHLISIEFSDELLLDDNVQING